MRRRIIGAVAAAGLALALAACSGGSGSEGDANGSDGSGAAEEVEFSERITRGVPEGVDWVDGSDIGGDPAAGWIVEGETFAVVTWGSSSCPPVASKLVIRGGDRIELSFAKSPNEICTADMSPTTQEFGLPAGVSKRPVTLVLDFEEPAETLTFTLP